MSWTCFDLSWKSSTGMLPDEEAIAALVEVFDHAGYGVHADQLPHEARWMACFMSDIVPEGVVEHWVATAAEMGMENFAVSQPYLVEKQNWNENWRAFFTPQVIGKSLAVVPAWDDENHDRLRAEGRSVILIEPGMAFGTGTHETTKLCMVAIEDTVRKDDIVLDAGTGSGILAIAALKCGCKHAFGFDLDQDVEENFWLNCELNKVSKQSMSLLIGGIDELAPAAYDLVVCNMLSREFLPILPQLVARLSLNSARLILSGLLTTEENEVRQAASDVGLTIIKNYQDGEWAALVCERG